SIPRPRRAIWAGLPTARTATMRDLMFAMMMLMAVPLAIARPFNAYLLWAWTAVVIPTSYFYGFMASARLNFLFAILTLLLIALGRAPSLPDLLPLVLPE